MNVEIVTEAPQFPEKEYINGIFIAMRPYGSILPEPLNADHAGVDPMRNLA